MLSRRAILRCAPLSLILILQACSEPPKQSKEPEKPAEPVGAQFAFHQVFLTARTWASDILVMSMRDVPLSSVKAVEGRRGAWEVTVVSPSKAKSRTYMYSVAEEGNIHQGVFAGLEEGYSGPRGQSTPWPVQAFKIDSQKAYEVAVEKSADFIKQNPTIPITFLLEQNKRHPYLTWRVIWGTSIAASGYSVYVNATTGEFVEKMR